MQGGGEPGSFCKAKRAILCVRACGLSTVHRGTALCTAKINLETRTWLDLWPDETTVGTLNRTQHQSRWWGVSCRWKGRR